MRASWIVSLSLFLASGPGAALALAQHEGMRHGTMDPARKNVAVLLYQHTILLDFAIPAEMFRAAAHGAAFNVYTVAKSAQPVTVLVTGDVTPQFTVENAPSPDILIIPGGITDDASSDPETVEFIERTLADGGTVLAVCTGVYVLAKSGFLDGREATSLHAQLDLLRLYAPGAIVRDDVGYVVAGNVVTTAGAATAVDATLALIEQYVSAGDAEWVADQYLDYAH